jgi:hypothetical protein
MVRALLDGKKTQTRRVIKDPDFYGCTTGDCSHGTSGECQAAMSRLCKYGQAGDHLWVRETWKHDHQLSGGGIPRLGISYGKAITWKEGGRGDGPWKPSIFMPRWGCRILLEIVDVRFEPLQTISVQDAIAEGAQDDPRQGAIFNYRELWEKINGAGSWDDNPWVWVIEFKRIPENG